MKLKIRQTGKYYQIGYYEKSKWILVLHLGTPERLIRKLNQNSRTNQNDVLKTYEQIFKEKSKNVLKINTKTVKQGMAELSFK